MFTFTNFLIVVIVSTVMKLILGDKEECKHIDSGEYCPKCHKGLKF